MYHPTNPLIPFPLPHHRSFVVCGDDRKSRRYKHSSWALRCALEDFEQAERDATLDLWQGRQEVATVQGDAAEDDEYVHVEEKVS